MSTTTPAAASGAESAAAAAAAAARRRIWPIVLGAGYSLTWIVGLSIWPTNLDVRSTGPEILAASAGHRDVAAVQYVLTEGLPGLGLIAMAVLLAGLARRGVSAGRARAVFAAGALAGLISLVQTGIGLDLSLSAAPAGHASTAHTLFEAVNRLDGVKMLVIAAFALAAGPLFRRARGPVRRGELPRWLGYAGIVLAASIAVSGIGYLLLIPAPAQAAWVSLPALLVWITGSATAIGRSTGK
jgi:hypothetical protein